MVWFGTWVGLEHCAPNEAATKLQAQNQSAFRMGTADAFRKLDAALIV
jgi:hypothetical protein